MKTSKPELEKLINYIEYDHNGDYVPIIAELAKAIYMLHYVEAENVNETALRNTCYELSRLIECFCEADYLKRKN